MENERVIINKENMKRKNKNNKFHILKKILAWGSVVLIILFTIFMVIVGGFISDYELDHGGKVGIPLEMPIAVLIGTLISLFAVLAMTWYFFWDPVNEKLEKRKEKIQKEIDEASNKNKEAEINNEKSIKELDESKKKALGIVSSSKQEAIELKKEIIDLAKKQSETMMEKSREQIENEKKQMQDDVKQEIISTSILAAEKIIEKELSDKNNEKLISDLIDKMKE